MLFSVFSSPLNKMSQSAMNGSSWAAAAMMTYGTIQPQSQTSSTWTTDDKRRAAGLSQQQHRESRATITVLS